MQEMETRWGKRFGRYEIIAELGRGAMGVVYKARDPKIDRFVAVKTVNLFSQNAEEQHEYRERFFHEAQAAGRLLHPGIVTIFDTGEEPENRIPYLVMEYIPGQSLDRLLAEKTKKLPLDTALLLAEELAEALDHAHGQGVVHRDMKPANILVTPGGHAKIADFGIAKMNLANLTLPGHALGTPAYMSPEQLEGERVDNRSDLFSLGAILYRMVTGYAPFQGNSAATVCFKVANRDPLRATAIDPELPSGLDAVIARAMAKDPAQRYQRAFEFALDLHELRDRTRARAKDPSGTTRFASSGEIATGAGNDAASAISSANLRAVSLKTLTHAARKILSFIRRQVWRSGSVRLGPPVAVATIVLGLLAFHRGQASRSSSLAGTPVGVGGELASPVSEPRNLNLSAGKVPSQTPSKAVADSTLDISIAHNFQSADISLWVDDQLAYDHSLRVQARKRWNPFRKTVQETETVRLVPGKHRLRVRVRSSPEKYEQSATISGSFAKGHPAILQINFEKRTKDIHLAWAPPS
jgi:serine/threonine protein kinase